MAVKLNNKILNYSSIHIVLEAGPTHTGLKSAKAMVDIAVNSNADSIKFQTIDADRLMADKEIEFEYSFLSLNKNGEEEFIPFKEPLYNILKRRELAKSEWKELKCYADKKGIHMFTTACFEDEVDFLVDELKIDSIKVNSSDISQINLIRHIAKKGVNIQLDTGSSDLWEIEKAVVAIEEEGNKNIIIHHCPSGYPAHLSSIHLKMITTLREMFPNYIVAFSDHSPGAVMDIAAVALGAGMVEKTITLDRYTKSCEHSYSLEGKEIQDFVKTMRDLEIALGNKRRLIPKELRIKRKNTRRSPYAIRPLKKGDLIREKDFEFRRPGHGLSESDFFQFIGQPLPKDIDANEPLVN